MEITKAIWKSHWNKAAEYVMQQAAAVLKDVDVLNETEYKTRISDLHVDIYCHTEAHLKVSAALVDKESISEEELETILKEAGVPTIQPTPPWYLELKNSQAESAEVGRFSLSDSL